MKKNPKYYNSIIATINKQYFIIKNKLCCVKLFEIGYKQQSRK